MWWQAFLEGLPAQLKVFQLHGETVKLRPGMELLGAGKFCPHQIVKAAPKAWGFQCHFELKRDLFEDWKKEDADLAKIDPVSLGRDFKEVGEEYRQIGLRIASNFLEIVQQPVSLRRS